nr:antirestriction protein ArdA [Rhodococcus sp. (in: high G+C Gram-positive bacteria)]
MGARVYVASLSDYNNAILHGEWFDLADFDEETIFEAVNDMLKESPAMAKYGDVAEEWAIHDFEGFGAYRVGEYDNLAILTALAGKLDDSRGYAFTLYLENDGTVLGDAADIDTAWDEFEDRYIGEMSMLDYAYDYIEDTGMLDAMPETLRSYFDYEAFARDLGMDHWETDGHLFRSY